MEKVMLEHKGEEPLELLSGVSSKDTVSTLVNENVLPYVGRFEVDSFGEYLELGKGLLGALMPQEQEEGPATRRSSFTMATWMQTESPASFRMSMPVSFRRS